MNTFKLQIHLFLHEKILLCCLWFVGLVLGGFILNKAKLSVIVTAISK